MARPSLTHLPPDAPLPEAFLKRLTRSQKSFDWFWHRSLGLHLGIWVAATVVLLAPTACFYHDSVSWSEWVFMGLGLLLAASCLQIVVAQKISERHAALLRDPFSQYRSSLWKDDWAELDYCLVLRPQDIAEVGGWILRTNGLLKRYHLWELRRRSGVDFPEKHHLCERIELGVWKKWNDITPWKGPSWGLIESMADGKMGHFLRVDHAAQALQNDTPCASFPCGPARRL